MGAGPPPLKTEHGWLLLYHGVASHLNAGIYQAGAVLLDLDDPSQVIARTRDNILEPRLPWELTGQVPGVVFPSGWVVREPDGSEPGPEGASDDAEALVYYGAADTHMGIAFTSVLAESLPIIEYFVREYGVHGSGVEADARLVAEAEELAYWLARLDEMADAADTDEKALAGVKVESGVVKVAFEIPEEDPK